MNSQHANRVKTADLKSCRTALLQWTQGTKGLRHHIHKNILQIATTRKTNDSHSHCSDRPTEASLRLSLQHVGAQYSEASPRRLQGMKVTARVQKMQTFCFLLLHLAHWVWAPHYNTEADDIINIALKHAGGSKKYPIWGVDRFSIMWTAGGDTSRPCYLVILVNTFLSNRLQPCITCGSPRKAVFIMKQAIFF